MTDPIYDPKSEPIYLVWATMILPNAMYPLVSLRAIDTTPEKAAIHNRMIRRDEPDILRVDIEERETNHCYGHNSIMLSALGRIKEGEPHD